ncbi:MULTISPECIES: hypothetical protein [Paraburkholderia]|uniref:hypothetical protein n=1 Tax=Paraburkholderia TaxID=1822464 RepID=UPI002AB01D59|nr:MULTISPECIES: hypothetical protein [Paraburkholderia]
MFTFIVIADPIGVSNVREWMTHLGETKIENGERLLVEGERGMADGWIAIQVVPEIEFDYEVDELARIKSKIHDPKFILVEGRNEKKCFSNEFILSLPDDQLILVDNDHGVVDSVAMIQKKIRSGEDWFYSDR